MSVSKSFDHYINRLKKNRSNNIHYQRTAQNISKLTKPFNHMSNTMSQSMRNNDAPESAKMQLNRDLAKDFNEQSYNMMNEASLKDSEREMNINERIADLQFKKDEAVRAEKDQKKQEKRQMIGTIGQVGGGLLGMAVSGGNPAVGAIGAGLGQAIGGVVDKSAPPDYSAVLSGLGDSFRGFSEVSQLKEDQEFYHSFMSKLGSANTSDEIMKLIVEIQQNRPQQLKGLLKNLNYNGVQ